jgi:hypothetical protein
LWQRRQIGCMGGNGGSQPGHNFLVIELSDDSDGAAGVAVWCSHKKLLTWIRLGVVAITPNKEIFWPRWKCCLKGSEIFPIGPGIAGPMGKISEPFQQPFYLGRNISLFSVHGSAIRVPNLLWPC